MSQTNVSNTYTSSTSISIPSNAGNIQLTVASGRGGTGGTDGATAGGSFGNGRVGVFKYITEFTARTPTLYVGAIGSNGGNNSYGGGGAAGGSSSLGSGGRGGNTGTQAAGDDDPGYSGGGGGGGGATGVTNNSGSTILLAGGGGGGGGGSWDRLGGPGGDAGGFSAVGSISPGNGAQGTDATTDGGGGGGGGGGAPGGGGGGRGRDQNFSSGGGGGGGSAYVSSVLQYVGSDGPFQNTPYINVSYTLFTPVINSFYYTPAPQTSGTLGNPTKTVTLGWSTTDAVTSVSINQGVGSVNVSGSIDVDTGLQSVAGSNSPATKSYTLTACAGTVCVTSTITVQVYNDNTPNSFSIPTTTTSGVSLNNLEPDTTYQILIGPIQGIDMITAVNCISAGLDATLNQVNYGSTRYISNGQNVYLRFTSQPFNSDPSGLTNSRTYNFSIGTVSSSFTARTRAPDVNETFDFGDNTTYFPYPDIDQIANTPVQYTESNTTITVDDVEIDVEIKTNTPDAQIRVKQAGTSTFGSWLNTREI